METFQTLPSPASLNGNGALPKPQPISPALPEPASMLAAWQLSAQQEEEDELRNLIRIVRRRAWVIAGVTAVVMSFITAKALRQEKVYAGQFRVLIEPVNADNDLSGLASGLTPQKAFFGKSGLDYDTQLQVLRSPELLEPVAEQLKQTYPELSYPSLLANLAITRIDETKILQVSYSGTDPVQIQAVLDQLSKTYLKYSLEERQTNLRQGINFVANQLPDLQGEVNRIQNQMEAFRRQYDFVTPEVQATQLSSQKTSLTEQRLTLDREFAAARQVFDSLQDQSGTLAALDDAPIYQQLLGELRSVETEIAAELTRFEPSSLSIRVLEEQRNNILPLLQQEAQRVVGTKQAIAANNLQVMASQSNTLSQAEQNVEQVLGQLPTLIRQYTDLQRELEVSTAALTRFHTTLETLKIEAAQTEIPWQLIEAPTQPRAPISPSLQRSLMLGFVASLLLGLGIAFLLEKLDDVYHTVDELKARTKLPLLGTLPYNKELKDGRTTGKGAIAQALDNLSQIRPSRKGHGYYGYGGNGEASFLEAIRVLYTNIRMLSSDRPIRSIVISSALPGDGKSTISANLAEVATAMGQRVLVVDVDLRKPQVHDRLNVSNHSGLSNLIADDLPLKAVIQQVDPEGQLFVLTAGKIPPDPTKLLASQKMQQLMETFERCFDLVIYDAPPTTGLADVSLIGRKTDGLVLVSRMGKTSRTVLTQTIETLKLAQITTLGMVANGVKSTGLGGYRYYAYGYGPNAATGAGSNGAAGSVSPQSSPTFSSASSSNLGSNLDSNLDSNNSQPPNLDFITPKEDDLSF
ncbi:MAG: polysaccharide biosynthesis tyrosine autokinase [Phormidesmis sp.]